MKTSDLIAITNWFISIVIEYETVIIKTKTFNSRFSVIQFAKFVKCNKNNIWILNKPKSSNWA